MLCIREAMAQAGILTENYSSHSFCIRAATTVPRLACKVRSFYHWADDRLVVPHTEQVEMMTLSVLVKSIRQCTNGNAQCRKLIRGVSKLTFVEEPFPIPSPRVLETPRLSPSVQSIMPMAAEILNTRVYLQRCWVAHCLSC